VSQFVNQALWCDVSTLRRTVWDGDREDGVRTLYRRNRTYDPASGQFTQEDPIGLAGGLNLYGFAGGDPINFSDPFGLCPREQGGDGKTKGIRDCPEGTAGRRLFTSGAAIGDQFSFVDLIPFGGIALGARRVAAGAIEAGLDASALTLTKTVAKNSASRPYHNSTLLMREIMRTRKPIADPGGIVGGLRWDVPGFYGKAEGVWELVVDPTKNQVVHFVFKSQKK
jgi:RHS repeat-associated protein